MESAINQSTMLLREFYIDVVTSESTASTFLQTHGLLTQPNDTSCRRCDGPVLHTIKKVRGKEYPVLRCRRKGCQAVHSLRDGNSFFAYTDINGKLNSSLSLCQILELR